MIIVDITSRDEYEKVLAIEEKLQETLDLIHSFWEEVTTEFSEDYDKHIDILFQSRLAYDKRLLIQLK